MKFRNFDKAKKFAQSLKLQNQKEWYKFAKSKNFNSWYLKWKKEINLNEISDEMDLNNPCYIPRNHLIENALSKALEGDMSEINFMINLFENPYIQKNVSRKYLMPSNSKEQYVTFCGT